MSLPNLSSLKPRTEIKLRAAVSEPIFGIASLLDTDYIHAAALLSTLVAETLLVPHSEAKRLNASDQVLRLVYDTLKCNFYSFIVRLAIYRCGFGQIPISSLSSSSEFLTFN
jgi:hypothetical protein